LIAEDIDLMAELLKRTSALEVSGVLDTVRPLLHEPAIIKLLGQLVAIEFPKQTRDWVDAVHPWSSELAWLSAGTYRQSREGLLQLLETEPSGERRSLALAAYLQPSEDRRFPLWFRQSAYDDQRVLLALCQPIVGTRTHVDAVIVQLLSECEQLPIAHFPEVLRLVPNQRDRSFYFRLLDLALRDAIRGFLNGTVPSSEAFPLVQGPDASERLRSLAQPELRSLLLHDVWNQSQNWLNAWTLLKALPRAVYEREPSVLPEVIDALLRSHSASWSPAVATTWSEILARSRIEQPSPKTLLQMAVQALRFAFDNSRLPLSKVVADVFLDVYRAVTSSSSVPPEVASMFGWFDWDKGKELRKTLVGVFVGSRWPPGDLALAANDPSLLRKIFKRVTRWSGGHHFLEAMLSDLQSRGTDEAKRAAARLTPLLQQPNFYEDWD
jgi:hypothetical protein